jgi:hypothetical protein
MSSTSAPARRFGLPTRHWVYKWVALLAGVIAVGRCAAIAGIYNHTTDELAHIAGAVGLYESGRNLYMVEHPTLQRLVVGGALKVAGVEYPPARGLTEVQARPEANVVGDQIVLHGRVPYWTVLAVARRANLVFLAVLLFFVYRMGRYLANPLAAMLATVFISVDANVLGHSALVTTDIPAAAGFLAATYYALRLVARPNWRRAIAAGVVLGLAMSCKFTCVLLVPAVVILMAVRVVRRRVRGQRGSAMRGLPSWRHLVAIPIIAFVALWATYLFNVGRLEDQHLFDEEKTWNRIPQWVKAAPVPMPSMPLGVMFMGAIGKTGFPCYFNGQLDLKGHLAYFPEAIVIKSPIGLVVGVALALGFFLVSKRRRPILTLCIVLPPSFLLLTAMTGKLQIGVRHVLPVIPFVYLFAAFHLHRGVRSFALVPLILLAAVETSVTPYDYLPFFNQLVGGPVNGSKYLADSNLDWGQDVARLSNYIKRRGAKDYSIKVSGVRVASLIGFLGLDPNSRLLSEDDLRNKVPGRDPEELKRNPHGLIAVGANAMVGLEDFKKNKDNSVSRGHDFSWVKKYPLVARAGYSIEVYDLDQKPAP